MHFELFTHSTTFCGLRVVLLGLYNGQRIDGTSVNDLVAYSREDADEKSFVRVLLLNGRIQGAILIGDSTLAVSRLSRLRAIVEATQTISIGLAPFRVFVPNFLNPTQIVQRLMPMRALLVALLLLLVLCG